MIQTYKISFGYWWLLQFFASMCPLKSSLYFYTFSNMFQHLVFINLLFTLYIIYVLLTIIINIVIILIVIIITYICIYIIYVYIYIHFSLCTIFNIPFSSFKYQIQKKKNLQIVLSFFLYILKCKISWQT